ncbi:MAG: hypothetical protein GXP49_17655 [Deltaproteobacteria bacterium]|nr:hypothetical protein [Deltaproteobacteria bacterium]
MSDSNELFSMVAVIVILVFLGIPFVTRLLSRKHHEGDPDDVSEHPRDRISQLLHDLARSDKARAKKVTDHLVAMGPDVLERLFMALGHADFRAGWPSGERSRRMLEELIAAFGSQAVPYARTLLQHPYDRGMQASGRRILELVGPPAVRYLIESGTKPDIVAVSNILNSSREACLENLVQELGKNNNADENIAAILLKAGPDIVPELRKTLKSIGSPRVRNELSAIVDYLDGSARPFKDPATV